MSPERHLTIEGAWNVRDIGGLETHHGKRVKRGLIYRSGALSDLTPAGIQQFQTLGIQTICDMRSVEEAQTAPDYLPPNVQYFHEPLDTEDNQLERLLSILIFRRRLKKIMLRTYTRVMVDRNAPLMGRILRRLADPQNRPAIIHCSAGKDRTGVLTALLLGLLGVPESTIIADYTQTNLAYERIAELAANLLQRIAFLGVRPHHVHPLIVADAAVMQYTLNHIKERYGSISDYLTTAAGLDEITLQQLRDDLLE
ncbi:MAG: hypothetical protein CUN56_06050 [Phototrophicales bacterium]|nr:MAG: hypothetical protein CUN56_06050 [Phototrophicales bacterium]RMG75866.1 MAG: tyrosine-protein phosphatase [Chloroflexota bacterium]